MKNNIKYILNKIEDNIKKHSSKEKNIKLIIVTKSQIIDDIKILINLGYKSFGENYLNEAKSKILTLSNENIEYDLSLWIDSQVNSTQVLTLAPGQTKPVLFGSLNFINHS